MPNKPSIGEFASSVVRVLGDMKSGREGLFWDWGTTSFISGCTAIGAVLGWAWLRTLPAALVGLPACLVAFLCAAIYKTWAKERNDANAAKEKLAPKLEIRFDKGDDCFLHREQQVGNYWHVRLLPICINGSVRVLACRGYLTSVEKRDSSQQWIPTLIKEKFPLLWALTDDTDPRTIVQGGDDYLNGILVTNNIPHIQIYGVRWPPRLRNEFKEHATYRLNFLVVGEDKPLASISLSVKWTGDINTTEIETLRG